MRALLTLIIALILIVVILVGGALAIFYFTFLHLTPAEYPFLHDSSEIKSIEYAKFTYGEEGLVPEKVGVILDTDSFIGELKAADCHTGIDFGGLKDLVNGKTIEGVVINYNDGSFDFITPYICVNSNYNPKGISELLGTRIYGFDEAQFGLVLEKYIFSVELPEGFEGDLDQLPEGWEDNLDQLPEGINPDDLIPEN